MHPLWASLWIRKLYPWGPYHHIREWTDRILAWCLPGETGSSWMSRALPGLPMLHVGSVDTWPRVISSQSSAVCSWPLPPMTPLTEVLEACVGLGCDAWQERPKTHRNDRSWAWQVSAAVWNRIGSWVPAACANCCVLFLAGLQESSRTLCSAIAPGRPDCEFELDPSGPSELGQVSQLPQKLSFLSCLKSCLFSVCLFKFFKDKFLLCVAQAGLLFTANLLTDFSVLGWQIRTTMPTLKLSWRTGWMFPLIKCLLDMQKGFSSIPEPAPNARLVSVCL